MQSFPHRSPEQFVVQVESFFSEVAATLAGLKAKALALEEQHGEPEGTKRMMEGEMRCTREADAWILLGAFGGDAEFTACIQILSEEELAKRWEDECASREERRMEREIEESQLRLATLRQLRARQRATAA